MVFKKITTRLFGDRIMMEAYKMLGRHLKGGVTGRTLASLVEASPSKMNQVLRLLVEEGILESVVFGKAHLYRFNEDHIIYREAVMPLLKLEEGFLAKLGASILERLEIKPLSIILYGSIARGEEGPKSDLDLCLVYGNTSPLPSGLRETGDLLFDYVHRTYGNPLSLISLLVSDFQRRSRKRDPLIRNIIREGRVLNGLSISELLGL